MEDKDKEVENVMAVLWKGGVVFHE